VIPWSPLAGGKLARKSSHWQNETLRSRSEGFGKRYSSDIDLITAQRVSDVAENRGLPMAQVALAWMLSKAFITAPIIGATKPHHLEDAVASLSVQLTPDEIRLLEEAYQPRPIMGHM
jgi:aryl-alcohol dehydrogenase-like predicted oxidoreductase